MTLCFGMRNTQVFQSESLTRFLEWLCDGGGEGKFLFFHVPPSAEPLGGEGSAVFYHVIHSHVTLLLVILRALDRVAR